MIYRRKRKRGLCAFHDKQYILRDGILTVSRGHYSLRKEQTRDFDETIPVSVLSTSHSPWLGDDENADAYPFVTLSRTGSVRFSTRAHMLR